MSNQGSEDFRGDLVLVPLPAAPTTAGAGGAGRHCSVEMLPAAHRGPFVLRPGASRTLSILLTAEPNRYKAEVHDPSGRLVARDEPRAATKTSGRDQVGLLSDQGGGRGLLATRSGAALDLSPLFSSAQDFPDSAVVHRFSKGHVFGDTDRRLIGLGAAFVGRCAPGGGEPSSAAAVVVVAGGVRR